MNGHIHVASFSPPPGSGQDALSDPHLVLLRCGPGSCPLMVVRHLHIFLLPAPKSCLHLVPPRPRANRWGEGARPLLPGTAPHPGVKTGVRGPIVETVVPVDCTPTHCAAPPDPGASAPHLEGGARTSWGSPLPSPVSRPPPPGAGLQGPALGSGSSRLHTILSPGSQTLHRLQGSQQPRTAGSVLGGEAGALPRVDEGSRTLSSCHAHHKSPASLGRFSNIKGNSLPETARGNSVGAKLESPQGVSIAGASLRRPGL